MQIPVRTPEGEPLRCPLCGNVAVLEVSINFRDATCPGCGFLLWSVGDRTQLWDLVRKAKGGDSDALHRLFQRYYERVRRSVRARMTSRQRARTDSDDIVQSAFAKAFENFDRLEMWHEGSFLNWLAEYAKRMIRDADGRTVPRAPLPDKEVRDDREVAIEECLEKLAEHHRMVIVLRDYDGLEWNEVAKKMGKSSDSAVRELHRRAMLELARLLQRRGIGPGAA